MSEKLTVSAYGEGWQQVADRLATERVASRIAAKDATVWGPAAESESAIRLSWVDLYESSRPLLAEIEALQADLRAEGLDRIVLAGMGGSSLAPEVITRTAGVELVVLDSTDPSVIARALAGDLQRTVLVVSSKSGGTVETDSQRRAFVQAFTDAGIDAASRIVVVTDPGSPFQQLAADEGYRKTFLADPHVGGRYSALTAFGLVPSALAGADVAELLDQAAEAAPALQADSADNPALVLAAVLAGSAGRDKAIIAAGGSAIVGFPDWAEQLIAESTGKDGKGVLPVAVESLDAPELHSGAGDLVHALLAADTSSASVASGTPTVVTTGSLGAQFLLWETATAAAGYLLGINPFDQPDVESAKQAARGLLDAQPEPEAAAFTDGSVEVRGSEGLLDGVDNLQGAVETLLGKLAEDGYLAVMAYLDSERDAALTAVRPALAGRTGRPVTFGWGPRFLHSTGQYHKGGHPQGVFLQITTAESADVAIPDRPFSFGTLIAAQAAGDAGVLAERGRPVLRLHLTDPAAGVAQLLSLFASDSAEAGGK
ncbi:glucose-6-phosphate isomerase [Kribbella amoyensis]|uniref:Glucose-6-phosphate isomerase n=1 Tax=Kribbella amoyensis TaxID=996641 RepID=A0A561BZR1_9ACTN|nr:glucose-6-phosphate isomerase [Kribbella amoyensis]TWD84406.1 glucose-6-phosphate isomerase [Kribbella amoyensis]